MPASKFLNKNKEIPWRRILIESVAIILSILLAFAIDAGWERFKERNKERVFLVSMLTDYKEARSRIDESKDLHNKVISQASQLLSFYDGDRSSIESEKLETILGAVFYNWSSLYLPAGSREALVASGDIEIITNEKLRAMLAAWPSRVADTAEDDILIANDVMNSMAPYLRSKIRTRNVTRMTNPDAAKLISPIESANYDALWNDPQFENFVTFRLLNETYAVYENNLLSEDANDIIRMIEEELNR